MLALVCFVAAIVFAIMYFTKKTEFDESKCPVKSCPVVKCSLKEDTKLKDDVDKARDKINSIFDEVETFTDTVSTGTKIIDPNSQILIQPADPNDINSTPSNENPKPKQLEVNLAEPTAEKRIYAPYTKEEDNPHFKKI